MSQLRRGLAGAVEEHCLKSLERQRKSDSAEVGGQGIGVGR